jgi:hypothetical protein
MIALIDLYFDFAEDGTNKAPVLQLVRQGDRPDKGRPRCLCGTSEPRGRRRNRTSDCRAAFRDEP